MPTAFRFIALVATLTLASCAGEPEEEVDPLLGTRWLAKEIDGSGVIDKPQSTLTFDRPERVFGNGGCNRFFGTMSKVGDEIEIGPLGGTRMACEEAIMRQESRFMQALERTRRVRHDEKLKTLYMDDANGRTILSFSRLRK